MNSYNRLNPLHWLLALFSNSRKNTYLHEGTLHVVKTKYKATQRILYWSRNPAHDFTHYIIGFDGDEDWTLYRGWNLANGTGWRAALWQHKWMLFPWVAYDGHGVRFELGWNDSGNLKFKLRRHVNV